MAGRRPGTRQDAHSKTGRSHRTSEDACSTAQRTLGTSQDACSITERSRGISMVVRRLNPRLDIRSTTGRSPGWPQHCFNQEETCHPQDSSSVDARSLGIVQDAHGIAGRRLGTRQNTCRIEQEASAPGRTPAGWMPGASASGRTPAGWMPGALASGRTPAGWMPGASASRRITAILLVTALEKLFTYSTFDGIKDIEQDSCSMMGMSLGIRLNVSIHDNGQGLGSRRYAHTRTGQSLHIGQHVEGMTGRNLESSQAGWLQCEWHGTWHQVGTLAQGGKNAEWLVGPRHRTQIPAQCPTGALWSDRMLAATYRSQVARVMHLHPRPQGTSSEHRARSALGSPARTINRGRGQSVQQRQPGRAEGRHR
ncbi:hypothetical protein NDU88_007218 [Pleurodeles waltl]|uniref:Uncharacterized protein n=1 Tax=Pleurodeles waltl TaxID=8319 RepID=A0AAV7LT02_PLEWA|nr:hypothetical protein NDU88_007218 [Pleurodeles waltl]